MSTLARGETKTKLPLRSTRLPLVRLRPAGCCTGLTCVAAVELCITPAPTSPMLCHRANIAPVGSTNTSSPVHPLLNSFFLQLYPVCIQSLSAYAMLMLILTVRHRRAQEVCGEFEGVCLRGSLRSTVRKYSDLRSCSSHPPCHSDKANFDQTIFAGRPRT